MASITIKDMSVSYNKGKSFVLDKLNLTIEDGEFCVFLGPSGCGKSTAMHCIAGLLHPASGEIRFGDEIMTAANGKGKKGTFVPPQERNIAMVFQEYALYPNMTVRENMSFALKTKKAPKQEIDKRVDYMAEMLSIEPLLERRPAELSGGQRQRVALGRALVRDPQVFLLDEPLGNLDAKLRDQVRYELKKIQEQLGITTIYVTHDQTEAMTMADKIVLLKDGLIMQQGTPNELYNHPANEFVASFLGTPQINIFPCDVTEENGALYLSTAAFRLPAPEDARAALKPYVGKQVDLGVRPSDFELVQEGKNAIPAHVDSIEPLGDAYLIYVRVLEKVVVFKYNGENAPAEKELLLAPNMAKLHLFDPETQNRINA
ncbi:MAG: ABC transporter ATP-binding protein [Oscillospiraceae bacterium]|jgi:multiple sugar transport system ATP-binding protein|nr:ABC transporter ATP-binding protein [Oscillospiraceae bacterium]